MNHPVLLDTGPLVAFLNRRDRYHEWTRTWFDKMKPPLLTCEPALAEACFVLKSCAGGNKAVLELLHRGILAVPFKLEDQVAAITKLMAKYANVPISLADACLVRMNELQPESSVMTLDSDFFIYRRFGRQVIPLITPEKR